MNQASSPAAQLKPHQRQKIALRVLTKKETISSIAEEERVSRKFLYKQGHIAQSTLTLAFEKPKKNEDVLFYLPVTQKWLSQLILALILICHCSYRGVVELLRDLFDYSISSELKIREEGSYKGIKAFRQALSKQNSVLLAFSAILDQKLQEISQVFDTSLYLVRSVCLLTKQKTSSVDYWQKWNRLHHLLPNKLHLILEAVSEAMTTTPRTSSLVENLNSRLRNYF